MPLIAMKRFHQKPRKPVGLIATLVISNVVCLTIVGLLWGSLWTSTKLSVRLADFYSKERSKWTQVQGEQALALEKLNTQISRLVGLQSSSPEDVLFLAQKISAVLDTATGPQRRFIEQALPHAIRLQVQYGIPASVVIAQSAYESRWGNSELAVEGNNYFGIKAYHWSGPVITKETKDRGVRHLANFRSYKDLAEGYQGYADFLKENTRYSAAFYTKSGEEFLVKILAAGYCPDSNYAGEVKSIMNRYNLGELDSLLKQGANAHYQMVLNKKAASETGANVNAN
jgi:flagellum-specific peptidoglycan hydrolase FlgJ